MAMSGDEPYRGPAPTEIPVVQGPGGSITGDPKPVRGSLGQQLDTIAENDAGDVVASYQGFNVRRLPENNPEGVTNPDLDINGTTTDVYAPATPNPWNVALTTNQKAGEQGPDMVLSFDRQSAISTLTPEDVISQLQNIPNLSLQKLYVVQNGTMRLFQFGGN